MRSDHDARAGVQGAGQIGDTRRGHRTQQSDIDPGRRQPRLQRRFEHVPGNARILADDDLVETFGLEHSPDRPAQLQHELRRNRIFADPPPNTVRTEVTLLHAISSKFSRIKLL